jgi:hypothetical protein
MISSERGATSRHLESVADQLMPPTPINVEAVRAAMADAEK